MYLELEEIYSAHQAIAIYTHGSKDGNNVAAATVLGNKIKKYRLPDKFLVFSADLVLCITAPESGRNNYIIFSDSLSTLLCII